jgi:DNA-directed RNA polymerase specialized sigma24 family protein
MLLGIPSLVLAATKAVEAVLKTFDSKLDAHSPSKELEKRGVWSGLGFMRGWNKTMNPGDVAQMMAKPLLNTSSSQQQNITLQFPTGLTIREVSQVFDAKAEDLVSRLSRAMAGA